MKVLNGCEESQAVTIEMRKQGIEAFSCDLLPCSGGHDEWHLKMDLFEAIELLKPDMGIFFPPCYDLAVSGARWFKEKQADGRQQASIDFFLRITKLPFPWAIENPIGIMSRIYRKPDQIIQPYQFGDTERKTTCLWLHDLPKLQPTNIVDINFYETKNGNKQTNIHRGMGFGWNTPECKKARSKTFPGIAKAFADQWSDIPIITKQNITQTQLF